jgi:hypothetical protein
MANKKINQLVSKTAILSTDIFGIGDATTGQLFKKTIAELQAAIGGAVISVNGLVGTVVLDTDDIQELATPTNKYFTDARARGAISLTVTGNSGASTYSSGTGVLNVPTYTLAGLGGISATFLSGTSGISYNSTTGVISYSGTVYTDASIRALFSGATGISYNSSTGAISYSGTVYTDSSVRALISLTTTGDSGASTYNNTTGVINVPNYTLAGLGGISYTSLSGGTGITYNNTTGAISYSGTVYTDASVRALISASGAVSYNNTTGVISLTGGNLTEATSSVLTITGGTGAVLGSGTSIQVKQATTSVSGFLSSTDWNTFNGKANALSGTTNYVPKFTSSTTIGNSIIFDNGTNIGISQANPFSGATSLTGIAISDRGGIYKLNVNNGIYVANNLYYDGSDWRRITANGGTIALFSSSDGGGFVIASAATGSAGSAATLTDRLTLTSAGKVGIGITSPTAQLHINSGSTEGVYSIGTGTNFVANANTTGLFGHIRGERQGTVKYYLGLNSDDNFTILNSNATAALTIMTSNNIGNVGIGRSFPNVKLVVSNNDAVGFEVNPLSSGVDVFVYNRSTSAYAYMNFDGSELRFSAAGSEKMRMHGSGNFAINTTADNGYKLYVAGTIYATGNITANSDLTLKKNLELITNPTDKLMQLNGYSYQWKSDDSHQYGVIAQEVEKILPYAVSTGNDGIKGVSYNQIIPVLIEAVKEQKKELEELRDILASK